MTTGQEALSDRVRALFADEPSTRDVAMFGGRAFLVDEKMVVHARTSGDLLVRVDPDADDQLVARPGAGRAEMGTGRSMGPGWISVSAASIATEEELSFWVRTALDHRRQVG